MTRRMPASPRGPRFAICFISVLLSAACPEAKRVEGSTRVLPGRSEIITKFCFDFTAECGNVRDGLPACVGDQHPGMMHFRIAAAAGQTSSTSPEPRIFIALLDDEYFSFPSVSQSLADEQCNDVLKAAKSTHPIQWGKASSATGHEFPVWLVEKLRPRWWYVALVNCAEEPLELRYEAHLENTLKGWQREFSMDSFGVYPAALCLCLLFVCLAAFQISSLKAWQGLQQRQLLQLHPALLLLSAAVGLSTVGQLSWARHYELYRRTGAGSPLWVLLARVAVAVARAAMSLLLLLLAHGECVCRPDICWRSYAEFVWGVAGFVAMSVFVETWGDIESTSTVYVYDTGLGMMLVGFDLLWLWFYTSRSLRTFGLETRMKPRMFYRRFAPAFGVWFIVLPAVAAIAQTVEPWVRFRIVFLVHNVAHVCALSLLVYTFSPPVASEVLDLRPAESRCILQDLG